MEEWDGVGLKLASGASRCLTDKGEGGGGFLFATLKLHPSSGSWLLLFRMQLFCPVQCKNKIPGEIV